MEVSLVMFRADGKWRDFPITDPVVTIGRGHKADLRVPMASVSREHARLEVLPTGIMIHDLGSSNGTLCNTRRIKSARIKAGDLITIGSINFTLMVNGEPAQFSNQPKPEVVSIPVPQEAEEESDEMASTMRINVA